MADGGALTVTVIIPALNEEGAVANAVATALAEPGVEVVVADGGSADRTADVARAAGARVIDAPRGKARQMNAGAGVASGRILLFLHADTLLPEGWGMVVRGVTARPEVALGAFSLAIDAPDRALRLIARGANLRSRWMRLPYGDQALFLRASLFRDLGGYPEEPILEDLLLVRAASRRGKVVVAPARVVTSSRRWRRLGLWRTTLLNQAILAAWMLGLPPGRMADWYRR
jgi:rSAM/selenodomain-associated transferase 2